MSSAPEPLTGACPSESVPVALTRTARGWSVVSPGSVQDADGLVEGLCLADLVAEEFGALTEPDRTARRSARGAKASRSTPPTAVSQASAASARASSADAARRTSAASARPAASASA